MLFIWFYCVRLSSRARSTQSRQSCALTGERQGQWQRHRRHQMPFAEAEMKIWKIESSGCLFGVEWALSLQIAMDLYVLRETCARLRIAVQWKIADDLVLFVGKFGISVCFCLFARYSFRPEGIFIFVWHRRSRIASRVSARCAEEMSLAFVVGRRRRRRCNAKQIYLFAFLF